MSEAPQYSTATEPMRLLPCPFCGGPAHDQKDSAGIYCRNEDCRVRPHATAMTKDAAIRIWNARAGGVAQQPVERDALAQNADLERRCIAAIETQNWTDHGLTNDEKHLIGMAVGWTANVMRGVAYTAPDRDRIARAICCPSGCQHKGDSEDGEKCYCDTTDFNGSGIEKKTDAVLSALSSCPDP